MTLPELQPKVLSVGLPPTFDSFSISIPINRSDVDMDALFAALGDLPGFVVRIGEGAWGALRGYSGWKSAHAHFSLERGGSLADFFMRIEILRASHGKFPRGVPRVGHFLSIIAQHLKEPNKEYSALLGAHFTMSMSKWKPTIPLPFTSPGSLEHIPGFPKISGVDFSFSSTRNEDGLFRAFVTTYDSTNEMVVRLLATQTLVISPSIVEITMGVAMSYLPKFAEEI